LITPTLAADRISQGDIIYLNETIDISGVTGWASTLGYYGGYFEDTDIDPIYEIKLPGKIKNINYPSQYNFYIDPVIFGNKTGNWYQWYGDSESHGNNLAFVVRYGNRTLSTGNMTNETFLTGESERENSLRNIIPPPVPTRTIADYLIAKGDDLEIKVSETSRVWIFGSGKDGLYNLRSWNGSVYIDNSSIEKLPVGTYKILIQTPGNDGEFNVIYDEEGKFLNSLYTSRDNWTTYKADVSGLTPLLLLEKVVSEIDKTNDGYKLYKMEVQFPSVEITVRDDIEVGTVNVIQVKGYTNTKVGSNLCFVIDEKVAFKSMSYTPTCVLAQGNQIGDSRYFIASIPFSYRDLGVGTHFISGWSELNPDVKSVVPFYVYTSFDDKPKNTTSKYIDGNLFVPTPTPQIIKVVETQIIRQVVTQVVQVQLTPDEALLYETTKTAQDTTILQSVCAMGVFLICCYIASVAIRGRGK
jgi:hypothetical protein